MENTNKEHGVVAERVLEKQEQKELNKAKDKETKSEIRGKLADIVDEVAITVKLSTKTAGCAVADGDPCNAVHIQIRSQFEINPCVGAHSAVHHFGNIRQLLGILN